MFVGFLKEDVYAYFRRVRECGNVSRGLVGRTLGVRQRHGLWHMFGTWEVWRERVRGPRKDWLWFVEGFVRVCGSVEGSVM